MIQFFRRLLGQSCCIEFTQWVDMTAAYERAPTHHEAIWGCVTKVTETRRWQERRCTICGKIQQRKLDW